MVKVKMFIIGGGITFVPYQSKGTALRLIFMRGS